MPINREILADLETPVSAFLKIDRGRHAFLLESVEGGEKWGRYSFLGSEPERVWTARGHAVEVRTRDRRRRAARGSGRARGAPRVAARVPPGAGARLCRASPAGPSATSATTWCASSSGCRRAPATISQLPDVVLLLADPLLVFDNVAQKIKVIANLFLRGGHEPA